MLAAFQERGWSWSWRRPHATRHGRFLGRRRRTAPRSSRSVPRAAGRTDDAWVGVESIHPSIHPTVQPTQRGPRRNHPTENLMSFTLLSIRRRVHMPCVRDAATFSCRHRPAACRPCPPPCPVLSSPVLSCAAGRPLQAPVVLSTCGQFFRCTPAKAS